MTNWKKILNEVGSSVLEKFAFGKVSGRQLTEEVAFTPAAGEVRSLLRNRKITYARRLARKAVRRRT